VQVIAHSLNGGREELQSGSIHTTRIPGIDRRLAMYTDPARWLTWSVEVAVTLAEMHARRPFDIVDFAEWGGEGYLHLVNRTRWNHVPTVIQLHGPLVMLADMLGWPDRDSEFYRVGTHMEGTCLRLADALFSSSQCSIDWCANHYGITPDAVPVLHTGVDTELFQPREVAKESRPTIVFVGKVVENKGADVLVEATGRLLSQFPGLQLWLVGRGESEVERRLRERAATVGAAEALLWKGFMDHQALADLLPQAHVFAAPSVYEGGPGFVYLEAMSCGLPAIACEGSGAAECITPGETGYLVPPGNVEALCEALRRLLASPTLCHDMGRRGRHFVLRQADSRECLKRLEAFYIDAADRFGGSQRLK
jgi:glycosyltransferase involved in cell wall biosynthesis